MPDPLRAPGGTRPLGAQPIPFGTDPTSVRRRVEALEKLLEHSLPVPGLKRSVGIDAIAGLVPVAGDVITAAMGAWLIWEGRNLGMPRSKLVRMAANVGVDTLLGAIPFVGDAFDFLFRSNTRNLRLIKRHLDRHHPATAVLDG